jgi:bifunctional DNA-binding transcriptional regulator/antitoxin component of YhaV-PrlF toxin-antitoxin module
MSDRGQIIIPKEVRMEIGADKDAIFLVEAFSPDTIIMKKLDRTAMVKEFRELRAKIVKLSDAEIESEIAAARKELQAKGYR